MPGSHRAPGSERFYKELFVQIIRVSVWIALVILLLLAIDRLPDLLADDEPPTTVAASAGTTTTQPVVVTTAAPTTSATVTTTAPAATTTVPPTTPTSTQATTTTIAGPRAPADIEVLVLNSTSISGLAAGATAQLNDAGYQTLEPDNYLPNLNQTTIFFIQGYRLEAVELTQIFTDAVIEPNPSSQPSASIVVVLGDSFTG